MKEGDGLLDGNGLVPDGFILHKCHEGDCGCMMKNIRKNDGTALLPIFLEDFPSEGEREAVDGPAHTREEMERLAEEILTKLADLDENMLRKSLDLRLLAFLYSRNGKKLLPVLSPFSREMYSYPLAEALSGGLLDVSRWITELVEKGYIEEEHLIDRVRCCPKCGGGHLNYVDVCPFCRSMDIHKVPFIHCFTCGRVGPQDTFLVNGRLQCPFCSAVLRHIGSDYDRPLENFLCAGCSRAFTEPEVSCRCFLCGAWSAPDDLVVRLFYEYVLSDKGVLAVRSGTTEDMYAILDMLNYMKPEPFRHILDWMIDLSERPPVVPFSLLLVSFPNLEFLVESIGRRKSMELIEALTKRLRALIRTTDISTRTAEHDLVLLLPKTPQEGCAVLVSKIHELEEFTLQPDGSRLELSVKALSYPEDLRKGETAALFVARLKGE